jgi:hypothetical protein
MKGYKDQEQSGKYDPTKRNQSSSSNQSLKNGSHELGVQLSDRMLA